MNCNPGRLIGKKKTRDIRAGTPGRVYLLWVCLMEQKEKTFRPPFLVELPSASVTATYVRVLDSRYEPTAVCKLHNKHKCLTCTWYFVCMHPPSRTHHDLSVNCRSSRSLWDAAQDLCSTGIQYPTQATFIVVGHTRLHSCHPAT